MRVRFVAIAALLAVGGLVWFGDLLSAIPIDVYENGGGEPLLQPPAVAVALVERALIPYGGLPHDAELTGFASEQTAAIFPRDATAPLMRVGFDATYRPHGATLWKDRILTRVEAVTQQACLDGGTLPPRYGRRPGPAPTCRRYVLTFPLHMTSLKREWRPWIVRRIARWGQHTFAPAVGAPASVTSRCSRAPDVGALRRVVAAIDHADYAMKQILDRQHTELLWTRALAQPGATIARWDPPYPAVPVGKPVAIVAAGVGDGPNRIVTVRFAKPMERPGRERPSVLTFSTTDDELVCGSAERPPELHVTRPGPSWDSIVAMVRARAETEVRWRTSGHRAPLNSSVVAVQRRLGAMSTVLIETSQPSDGRWRARFTVDERVPEIREGEFTRVGG